MAKNKSSKPKNNDGEFAYSTAAISTGEPPKDVEVLALFADGIEIDFSSPSEPDKKAKDGER
jgi:hypothetical protein